MTHLSVRSRLAIAAIVLALAFSQALGGVGAADPGPAGTWRWPLTPPEVVRGFHPPVLTYGPGHRGVDLAGRPGQPVTSTGPGLVWYAGVLAGRGVISVVHAGGLRTTYLPVVAEVRRGQRVPAGGRIGTLRAGHPGCARAACLHWGLRRGARYLNPLTLVTGEVRLLPLGSAPRGAPTAATDRTVVAPAPEPTDGTTSSAGERDGDAPTAPQVVRMISAAALAAALMAAVARGRPP